MLLRRPEGGVKYQVISGFRRITAIKSLRWPNVSAIVRGDLDDHAAALRVSVLENEERRTYTDIDRAHAIIAYRDLGATPAEIEELFQVGSRQRQRLEKLTTFPETLQTAISDEHVSTTNAIRLMQHADQHPDTDVDAWIQRIRDEKMTYAQLNKALKMMVAQTREQRNIELFVERDKNGVKSLRVRPISIDASLTPDQRTALVADLKRAVAFVQGL